uniref:Transporter n=1 Tax=Anas zonorhyncha TaxID=75864 RepID=A0A8B9VDL6_9AVES
MPVPRGISPQSSPSCSGLLQTRPLPATGGQRDAGTGWVLQSSHAAGFAERFPIPLIEKGWGGPRRGGLCTTRPHRGGVHSPGGCSAVPRWHFAARGLLKQLLGGVLHGHRAPPEGPPRETWAGRYEFLLSCLGYCVGLGNVWRFPYLCYRNGGGVFLIPYFILLFLTGLPLFLMELSLGQYGAAGPITVWKCCPILRGVGVGMLLVSSLVSLYYNVIIAWTFYYLGSSFQSPLPWSCDAPQNAELCQVGVPGLGPRGQTLATHTSASEAFWKEQVLGVTHSSGLGDPGPVQWPLALCLLAAWVVVFLCMLKGIRSSGKVVYFTATFPYVVILILIIRGATLSGSLDGVRFYLSSDWSKLQSAQVWSDAASQIFYSLGIGFGGLLSMASYNKFDNNVIRDTLVIAIGNCCTSFFAGFAIFSVLGHMALKKGVPVGSVADSGPGLAFVAYPEALSLLPGSPFWSILFFLMLFTLGVDTMFGNIESITTAILDEFPALREWRRKALFLGVLTPSLPTSQGGIFWFTLIDTYSTGFGLVIITLFMCLGISFCYGHHMLGYFKLCWVFFTPCLLLVSIGRSPEMYGVPLRYGSYTYPAWGTSLGICVGVLTCLQVPLWAIVALCRESGTLSDVSVREEQGHGDGDRDGVTEGLSWCWGWEGSRLEAMLSRPQERKRDEATGPG